MPATTIHETESLFRADPTKARSKPAVTATLANGRARLSAGAFNWDADLPAVLGGGNLSPSPTAYLLGALAGCAVAFLHDTLAPQFGVEIDGITAVAGAASDLRGLLGDRGRDPGPGGSRARHPRDDDVARRSGRGDVRRVARALPDLPRPAQAERHRADDLGRLKISRRPGVRGTRAGRAW